MGANTSDADGKYLNLTVLRLRSDIVDVYSHRGILEAISDPPFGKSEAIMAMPRKRTRW